ncbi:ATPase [Thiomicrospira aerophila AL3]|uniref:ATPase n=1 Tax=Thiomicrospira aerophila AL3 TaxID=717772 RepID=W0DPV8_9GAMM|nr:cation-translocating P-type ATPase [Thiomicrospira aerophila]AHF00640.1 ATPase [Thiomicrospira aerophila AL3]
MPKLPYRQDPDALAAELNTDLSCGMTQHAAQQRRQEDGPNIFTDTATISSLRLLLQQFTNPLLIVLMFGALLSFVIAHYVDAIAIAVIILINALISFVQAYKAQKSIEALRTMAAPKCWVRRDNQWQHLAARDLVRGDIIKLDTGAIVPADARLIDISSLHIDESALTGESEPVSKHTQTINNKTLAVADQTNMVFMSTAVTHGQGTALVTAIGMNTEVGHIAQLMQQTETRLTPLQLRILRLSKLLIWAAAVIISTIIILGMLQSFGWAELARTGISLAVAAIPEGLPTVVTIVLTLGAYQMMRSNALAKQLNAVETLGSTSIICSDKTGTLTQNKMQVTQIWQANQSYHLTGLGYEPQGEFLASDSSQASQPIDPTQHTDLTQLLDYAALCNDAVLIIDNERYSIHGMPTEGALIVAAAKANITQASLATRFKRLASQPFDSERKMMSVVIQDQDQQAWLIVKGAPDVLLARCNTALIAQQQASITRVHQDALDAIASFGQQALRTLAVAIRPLTPAEAAKPDLSLEYDLTLVGLFGIIDPPRPEAITAIADCHEAGIAVAMITGDHAETAKAIAFQMGITTTAEAPCLVGEELNQLDEFQLTQAVKKVRVFARVTPEHKLRIVQALQANQEVVAMTGDGVNDAPALRSADIGVAMGIAGTGVAKESADLILLDDNFATIVMAVREGRRIYDNIRKFIRQGLTANVSEVSALLFAFAFITNEPLLTLAPLMILWVNLISDGLPALALGIDQAEKNVMSRPPRSSQESLFAQHLGTKIIVRGLVLGAITFGVFQWAILQGYAESYAQTLAFMTLIFGQLVHIFDARSFGTLYDRNPFNNPALVLMVLASASLSILMVYWSWGQLVLGTSALTIEHLLIVMFIAALPTLILSGANKLFRWHWL